MAPFSLPEARRFPFRMFVLDKRGIGCSYPQITFFTLRSTIMAHKKIERKKELDRRRKRRAERIKARIHEAQAAAKNSK